jgi:hypothetical protein
VVSTQEFVQLKDEVLKLKTMVEETIMILIQHSRYSKYVPVDSDWKAKSISDPELNQSTATARRDSLAAELQNSPALAGALPKMESPRVGKVTKKKLKSRSFNCGPNEIYTRSGRLIKPPRRLTYTKNFVQVP